MKNDTQKTCRTRDNIQLQNRDFTTSGQGTEWTYSYQTRAGVGLSLSRETNEKKITSFLPDGSGM